MIENKNVINQNTLSTRITRGDETDFNEDTLINLNQSQNKGQKTYKFMQWIENILNGTQKEQKSINKVHSLYSIEIHTPFSKSIILKKFDDFIQIQKIVSLHIFK